jgi:hypothetical protein
LNVGCYRFLTVAALNGRGSDVGYALTIFFRPVRTFAVALRVSMTSFAFFTISS